MDLASPSAIGSTTPNTGAFTTLSATPSANTTLFTASGYSLTGANAQSFFDLSGTLNTTGNPTLIKANWTLTAAGNSTILIDLQTDGTSRFKVDRFGALSCDSIYGQSATQTWFYMASTQCSVRSSGYFGFSNSATNAAGTQDVQLFRDAAYVLAQRTGTNAQTFRLYNTYTDASNYERGFFRWSTNVLEIGAEAAGTGTQRQLRLPLGTVTASTPLSVTQTWNSAGVTFTGIQANITDTASASASLLMDLQTGGTSRAKIDKSGNMTALSYTCTANSTLDGIISRQASMYGGGDANGTWVFQNSNFNNFNMLKLGGATSSFPALKRSSAVLQARLADDSGFAQVQGKLTTDTNYTTTAPLATGYLTIYDATGTAYKVLCST